MTPRTSSPLQSSSGAEPSVDTTQSATTTLPSNQTATPPVTSAADLLASFTRAQERKGNRKRMRKEVDQDDQESGKDLVDYGRGFVRLGEPFTQVFQVVEDGLRIEADDMSDDEDADEDEELEADPERSRKKETWDILCSIIPKFKEQMVAIAEKRQLRRSITAWITEGQTDARQDDTNKCKSNILQYIHLDTTKALDPAVNSNTKAGRGIAHPEIAPLLIPLEWEANDETIADLREGRKTLEATRLPRLLFPEGHVLDPDDPEDGLFKSHILIRVAKMIYIGPSSALKPPGWKKGRPGNAAIIGMKFMTPRALAYVVVQAHFALSSTEDWRRIGNFGFDYEVFYWHLVSLLEGDEGKAILRFYDMQLWGSPASIAAPTAGSTQSTSTPSLYDVILARRAAKRARLAPQASTATSPTVE